MTHDSDQDFRYHPSRSRPGARYAMIDGALVTDGATLNLYLSLQQAARSGRPLLFSGEAGTGKLKMARTAHRWSGREGRLHWLDGATPPDQIDGALADHGGTVLLTHVEQLALPLQERAASAAGGLMLTSRMPLAALGASGKLHPALARAIAAELALPPLRAREHAVRELFCHFVHTLGPNTHPGWRPPAPDPAALELLAVRRWPGNVTELRAVVVDLLLNGREGPIGAADLRQFEPGLFTEPLRAR